MSNHPCIHARATGEGTLDCDWDGGRCYYPPQNAERACLCFTPRPVTPRWCIYRGDGDSLNRFCYHPEAETGYQCPFLAFNAPCAKPEVSNG